MGQLQALAWLFFGRDGAISRRDWLLLTYSGALSLSTVILLTAMRHASGQTPLLPTLILSAAALVAEVKSVRLSPRAQISVSFVPIIFAAVVYGPLMAAIVGAASLLSDIGSPYLRWIMWVSSRSLAATGAGLIAQELGGQTSHSLRDIAPAVTLAMVVEQLGGFATTLCAATIRGGSFRDFRREASAVLLSIPLYAPVMALLVFGFREFSPWTITLFLLPAVAAQRLFVLYREQRQTSEELSTAIGRLERANLSFATGLVATLDARDRYTAGHSAAVAIYSRDIAVKLGLSDSDQELAHLCGLVHDIGKIGLPPGLLEKPGPLTLNERAAMEEHAAIGEGILLNVEGYEEIARTVRHHHERFDGEGYPDHLAGEDIPLVARLIAVADSYNAMTSDRPYREAMPSDVARVRLASAMESQLDPTVVAAFEEILSEEDDAYREARGGVFGIRSARLRRGGTRLRVGVGRGNQSRLRAGSDPELLEDMSNMDLHRRLRYEESLSNAPVGQPPR